MPLSRGKDVPLLAPSPHIGLLNLSVSTSPPTGSLRRARKDLLTTGNEGRACLKARRKVDKDSESERVEDHVGNRTTEYASQLLPDKVYYAYLGPDR